MVRRKVQSIKLKVLDQDSEFSKLVLNNYNLMVDREYSGREDLKISSPRGALNLPRSLLLHEFMVTNRDIFSSWKLALPQDYPQALKEGMLAEGFYDVGLVLRPKYLENPSSPLNLDIEKSNGEPNLEVGYLLGYDALKLTSVDCNGDTPAYRLRLTKSFPYLIGSSQFLNASGVFFEGDVDNNGLPLKLNGAGNKSFENSENRLSRFSWLSNRGINAGNQDFLASPENSRILLRKANRR